METDLEKILSFIIPLAIGLTTVFLPNKECVREHWTGIMIVIVCAIISACSVREGMQFFFDNEILGGIISCGFGVGVCLMPFFEYRKSADKC
jgi:hypothetical protein